VKPTKKIVLLTTGYGRDSQSDNGGWANQTSTGMPLKQGVVAVSRDPNHRALPLGTKINVKGYGQAIVGDVGSAVKPNQLDLCFNNTTTADKWKKKSKVTVYRK
jgi:3D (Asp-Asp-Asp) domain-containing protein